MYNFSVDYNSIDKSDIHKYLMIKNNIKKMFSFVNQLFVALPGYSSSLAHIR